MVKIKIREGDKNRDTELETLCRQLGHVWPPRHQAEATAILIKAGFTQERTEQFLAMAYRGFDDCGTLPEGYVSTAAADGFSVFTPMLIEGLRKVVDERNRLDPWQGWDTSKVWCNSLNISTKTLQRRIEELCNSGLAMRKSERGKINLRQSATDKLKEDE